VSHGYHHGDSASINAPKHSRLADERQRADATAGRLILTRLAKDGPRETESMPRVFQQAVSADAREAWTWEIAVRQDGQRLARTARSMDRCSASAKPPGSGALRRGSGNAATRPGYLSGPDTRWQNERQSAARFLTATPGTSLRPEFESGFKIVRSALPSRRRFALGQLSGPFKHLEPGQPCGNWRLLHGKPPHSLSVLLLRRQESRKLSWSGSLFTLSSWLVPCLLTKSYPAETVILCARHENVEKGFAEAGGQHNIPPIDGLSRRE
jgi:hypothetical protein